MFITKGKIYWDCRRSPLGAPKFFVDYLALTYDQLQSLNVSESFDTEPDTGGIFTFGDYQVLVDDTSSPTIIPNQESQDLPHQPTQDLPDYKIPHKIPHKIFHNIPHNLSHRILDP